MFNIVDIVIIAIIGISIIFGAYKGFLTSILHLGSFLICALLAFLLTPVLARALSTGEVYETVLGYTDGAQLITNFEDGNLNVSDVSRTTVDEIIEEANLPFPIDSILTGNIAGEVFAAEGAETISDYFNKTIAISVLNILCFVALFLVLRLIMAFVINLVHFVTRLPVLKQFDSIAGGCFGAIRGVLFVFVLFMLVPIVLVMLPYDSIKSLVEESYLGAFFYKSNFILPMIRGVL